MSVHVDLHPSSGFAGGPLDFPDSDLRGGEVFCYHVGAGGELIVVVDDHGESRVHRVYGPTTWRIVEGDVWRKGILLSD